MYKVVYLPLARKQLTDAVLYIASDLAAPDAAESLLDEVDALVTALGEFPYRHPVYPALFAMKREIRYFPVKNFNVFYVVHEENRVVEIWRFLHRLKNTDI